MPDYGRVLLHFLLDRGIDEEWQSKKRRGILEGYTQEAIGQALGMDVSTVRRYERTLAWLGIIRTVPGAPWRWCSSCQKEFAGRCTCGSKHGPVRRRDPHKIIWLPSRTLDRDAVRAEKARLEATLSWQRRHLSQRELEALQAGLALSSKVLDEWCGREHSLSAFHNEMRRRLARNVAAILFPIKT